MRLWKLHSLLRFIAILKMESSSSWRLDWLTDFATSKIKLFKIIDFNPTLLPNLKREYLGFDLQLRNLLGFVWFNFQKDFLVALVFKFFRSSELFHRLIKILYFFNYPWWDESENVKIIFKFRKKIYRRQILANLSSKNIFFGL